MIRFVDGHPTPLLRSAERTRSRFAAGLVGKADDGEGGQADADVDLDGDGITLRSEDRGGLDGGEHGDLLRSQHGAAADDRRDGGPVRRRVPTIVPPGCDSHPVPHSTRCAPARPTSP